MAKCGHINRHSFGVDGKPDNLKCELEAGHDGLHQALHHERASQLSASINAEEHQAFEHVVTEDGREYYEGHIMRSWNDVAGIPAKEITPENPGTHIIQASHMFPEQVSNEVASLRAEIAELKKAISEKPRAVKSK